MNLITRIAAVAALMTPLAALAANCGTFTPSVTKNCTTTACVAEACWPVGDPSMTGCMLFITTPTGALPGISGAMNATKDICTITLPKLITGSHSMNVKGVNAFGEGAAMPTPLSLSTGTPPAAPSGVVLQ